MQPQVMAVGLAPSMGIIHGIRHSNMSLASDLIESPRRAVDQQILTFAICPAFHQGDLATIRLGVKRDAR
jgi:CRISPR/Cas system-associated endonuclease Cas1